MTTLCEGDRSRDVLELQTLLAMTGFPPGPTDGIFGPRTRKAVVDWQEARLGLDETGGIEMVHGYDEVTDDDLAALRSFPRLPIELPRVLTPATATDMRVALLAGYMATFPQRVSTSANAVRVALAQTCIEHGLSDRWIPTLTTPPWLAPGPGAVYDWVWNNNVGNRQVIDADRDAAGAPLVPSFFMSPIEGSGAGATKKRSRHYAYPNLAEGAAAYWRFLGDHCAPALAAFERGDPLDAAHQLKVGAWAFSGDEAAYAAAMVDRHRNIP